MRLVAFAVIALVVLQRLSELIYAQRNTRALKTRGATEIGAAHYPLLVLLHGAWLLAVLWLLPRPLVIAWWLLVLFGLLQLLRLWVIATLGPYWTTRIITLPGAPLVRRGPYRFLRHPNYVVVAAEIAVLPLAFGEVEVALIFSLANAVLLAWRIRREEQALAARRD